MTRSNLVENRLTNVATVTRQRPVYFLRPKNKLQIPVTLRCITLLAICSFFTNLSTAQKVSEPNPRFKAIAFYTAKHDLAHISFVTDAKIWFAGVAAANNFQFDTTSDWSRLNTESLTNYQLVIFFDTRPDDPGQRAAFEHYMRTGGGWIGFHFSGFALTPSDFPQNWDWYHEEFLGAGQYAANTWRPTSALLKIEAMQNPIMKGLPVVFRSSPNEWYRWSNDLRKNPDIEILLAIDSSGFPLGTGPKKHEIWTSGYYPVAWSNKKYRMVYFNMGHNDMDYEKGTNKTLSHTFGNPVQDRLILNTILYLGKNQSLHKEKISGTPTKNPAVKLAGR
jgi:uncharacterized protein